MSFGGNPFDILEIFLGLVWIIFLFVMVFVEPICVFLLIFVLVLFNETGF